MCLRLAGSILIRPHELSQGTLEIIKALFIIILSLMDHAERVKKFPPPTSH